MSETLPTVSPLTAHLGFWMRLVSNHVSHAFARELEASGVTVAEWVVLREMYGGDPMPPSRIAELIGLTRGAVSKLVQRLVEKELVLRREAPGDRRYQELELTPAAQHLVPQLARLADQNDATFFSALSAEERESLSQALRKLADHHRLTRLPVD